MTAIAARLRRFNTVTWRQVATLALLVAGSAVMAALHEKEIAIMLAGAAAGYAGNNSHREQHPPPQRPTP
jgi:hypothetical protein